MKASHKFLSVLLALCMVFCITPAPVFAADNVPDTVWSDYVAMDFAGGTGTEADPYQIATAEQLAKLSKDVADQTTNYEGKFFKLTKDIDLSRRRWVPIGIYKDEGDQIQFEGFIYGNNKTISGLIVDARTDGYAAGLFGNIMNFDGGTVGAQDLTISKANIFADSKAGILAGEVLGNPGYEVVFKNITVSGTVNGYSSVGGMIGYGARINATGCNVNDISITGASDAGGFIGIDSDSDFTGCKASGEISGGWGLGGFVGFITGVSSTQSVYEKCAADVDIKGSDWRLGGFAGSAPCGELKNCVSFGDVTSNVTDWEPKVGGFIGESMNAVASSCHAAGTVSSKHSTIKPGGFVGTYTGGTFTDCSFDSEKNSGLNSAGEGVIQSGVTGESSNKVLSNICMDYYGAHEVSDTTPWTTDVEPACTTAGSKSQHCARCDEKCNAKEIPAFGHNYVEGECTVCHEIDSTFKPSIKTGTASVWHKGSKDGLTFTSNAAYRHFQKVQIDGKDLDKADYEVKEGSTIVTLPASYLESLPAGEHKISIVSATGTAETTFTIAESDDQGGNGGQGGNGNQNGNNGQKGENTAVQNRGVQTGDNSNIVLWMAVMLMSGSALSSTIFYNRKKKYSR